MRLSAAAWRWLISDWLSAATKSASFMTPRSRMIAFDFHVPPPVEISVSYMYPLI